MLISFVIKNWILFWWMQNLMMQYLWTEMRNEMILKKPFFTIQNWKPVSNIVQSWNGLPKALSNSFIQFSFLFFWFLYTIWRFQNFKKFDLSVIFWMDFEQLANIILFVFPFPVRWTLLAHFWGRMTVTNGYVLNDTILN
jgi:hypothetical protein